MSGLASFHVVLDWDFEQPALVPAAFDLLRTEAAQIGLVNIGDVRVAISIECDGLTTERQIEDLRRRLDRLWSGGVKVEQVSKVAEVQGE